MTITSNSRRIAARPTIHNGDAVYSSILFACGLASVFEVNAIGTVYGSDVAFAMALPFLLMRRHGVASLRDARVFITLAALWLINAILTDVLRHTPVHDYARGWAKITFLIISISAVWMMVNGRIQRLMAYFAGLAFATIITTALFPTLYQKALPWKFGYSTPTSILLCIAASVISAGRMRSLTRYGAPLALGALNLALNFRSMFAMLIATAGTTLLSDLARLLAGSRRLASPAFALMFFIGALVAGGTVATVYGQLAESGTLGREAQSKYAHQSQGDLGILLGGRSESLASIAAIKDSPILGHGSWAKDSYYVALRILTLRQHGMNENTSGVDPELIPSHSYLLGAWVEAGIMGAIFWGFCLARSGQALVSLVDIRSPATPFAALLLIQLLWNIPFSPFGGDVRFYVAGQLCAVGWIARQLANQADEAVGQPLTRRAHA